MPTFLRQTLETSHKEEVLLNGSFKPNGNSNPVATEVYGNWISSVAHTATGKWTITMNDAFKGAVGWHSLHVSLSTAAAQPEVNVSGGAVDLSAGTIVVHAGDDDDTSGIPVAADIAHDADTRISVSISIKWGTVPDGSQLV